MTDTTSQNIKKISDAANDFFSNEIKLSFRSFDDFASPFYGKIEITAVFSHWRFGIMIDERYIERDDGRYLRDKFMELVYRLAKVVFTKKP